MPCFSCLQRKDQPTPKGRASKLRIASKGEYTSKGGNGGKGNGGTSKCPGFKRMQINSIGFAELSANSDRSRLIAFVKQEGLFRGDGKHICSSHGRQVWEQLSEALEVRYGGPVLYRGGPNSHVVEGHNGRLADALATADLERPPWDNAAVEHKANERIVEGVRGLRVFWRCIVSGPDAHSKISGIAGWGSGVIDDELGRMSSGGTAPPAAPPVHPFPMLDTLHVSSWNRHMSAFPTFHVEIALALPS